MTRIDSQTWVPLCFLSYRPSWTQNPSQSIANFMTLSQFLTHCDSFEQKNKKKQAQNWIFVHNLMNHWFYNDVFGIAKKLAHLHCRSTCKLYMYIMMYKLYLSRICNKQFLVQCRSTNCNSVQCAHQFCKHSNSSYIYNVI